jgi:hypothetical protein
MAALLSAYGSKDFQCLWQATLAQTQIAILAQLMLTLPMDSLLDFIQSIGVEDSISQSFK